MRPPPRRTLAELEAEIATLARLEALAEQVRAFGPGPEVDRAGRAAR